MYFRYYFPLEKGVALHESLPPKNALCLNNNFRY